MDINKKPANKEKTGNWKACAFILGMILRFSRFILVLNIFISILFFIYSLWFALHLPNPKISSGNECCERLAYYGMGTNLVNYLQEQLNQGNVAASNNVTNWSGTCYITPLIGAFVADAYLGRYWTIAIFSIIYFFVSLASTHNFLFS